MRFIDITGCLPVQYSLTGQTNDAYAMSDKQILKIFKIAFAGNKIPNIAMYLNSLKCRKIKLPNKLLVDAYTYNNCKVSELLIDFGLNPNYFDGYLLYCAADAGRHDFVDLYLRKGVDPDIHNGEALIRAINHSKFDCLFSYKRHVKIVNSLLSYGADPDCHNGSPLYLAAKHGHNKIIEALCNAGADVNINNNWALKIAAEKGNDKAILTLLYFGANFDSLDEKHKIKYEYLNDINLRHKNDNHSMESDVYGGCFFAWRSQRELMCDYLFELEKRDRLSKICHNIKKH